MSQRLSWPQRNPLRSFRLLFEHCFGASKGFFIQERALRVTVATLLFLSLPCQAEPPANIFSYGLYSKAECEAKGGVWRQRDDIEQRCYFRSMQDCIRNGGVEDRMYARHPKDFKCNFFLAEKKEKCLAGGGTWQPMGALRAPGCVRKTDDAGKACLSKSDCEAACLYIGSSTRSGIEAIGQCAADDNPFGCRSFVEKGKVVIGPCVD